MLICNCGWQGMNLVPNKKDDTARCPKCSITFTGISAEKAVIVSSKVEKDLKDKARRGIWTT